VFRYLYLLFCILFFFLFFFFFSSRRRHTRSYGDWSSDVCSSDLVPTPRHHVSREVAVCASDVEQASLVAECRLDDFGLDRVALRSEEHTSELQSPYDLVCRLLLEKKKERNAHALNM